MNNKEWFITNNSNIKKGNVIFKDIVTNLLNNRPGGFHVFIEGYVIPRLCVHKYYGDIKQKKLIEELYNKHGSGFIKFVKGSFVIIIINKNTFEVYNDRHNVKKYFIYMDKTYFIISNSIKLISKEISLETSKENAALYCLFSHYINDLTLFKGLKKSRPASHIIYQDEICLNRYWLPENLFSVSQNKYTENNIAECWRSITEQYISFLKPDEIGMTLTGGNDSRLILAGLLANGIKPKVFTYGHPSSADCVIAKKVSEKTGLDHTVHYIADPSTEWFYNIAKILLAQGNLEINIHRAHRYDALFKEKNVSPNLEMIFTGLVGGEYIKEPDYNDITIPKHFKYFQSNKKRNDKIKYIKNQLDKIGIDSEVLDLNLICEEIEHAVNLTKGFNRWQKKFLYTYYYYAVTHHTQDPNVFSLHLPYVVNLFMDVDFIEKLVCYKDWYVNKPRFKFINKIWHSYLLLKITDLLYRPLSEIEYAKKGAYTGEQMLRRPLKYLLKRFSYIYIKNKKNYHQNFPMGNRLFEYVNKEINTIHPKIRNLYKDQFMTNKLEEIKNLTTEENWHILTNPVNLSLNLKHFEER